MILKLIKLKQELNGTKQMRILAKLEFNDKKNDVDAIVYNIKSEFCDFYSSHALDEKISVEQVEQSVLQQLEDTKIAEFFASKDNVPFKVGINLDGGFVSVDSIKQHEIDDLTFYTLRALEACNNFAIDEFVAIYHKDNK